MSSSATDADVVVVGGGPVGLYLAAELSRSGASVIVLERDIERHGHSRSIGIHPPSLAALAAIGATELLIGAGVRVQRGWALSGRRTLGAIRFDTLRADYPFVVALPQHRTEAILEARLEAMAPDALRRGRGVEGVAQDGERVTVTGTRSVTGERFELTASFVVGCDGRDSLVRRTQGMRFDRRTYPDSYVMGDFSDDTDLGADAAIYLGPRGVVESFPLPGRRRRWVAKTPRRLEDPPPGLLAGEVARRTGVAVDEGTCSMMSSFGCERATVRSMVRGRVVVAGDSAHLVPPIGGQGMNLGWLDAATLTPVLLTALARGDGPPRLEDWAAKRAGSARAAMRRADLNIRLGRATRFPLARDALVRLMLARPFAGATARMFTMDGLG